MNTINILIYEYMNTSMYVLSHVTRSLWEAFFSRGLRPVLGNDILELDLTQPMNPRIPSRFKRRNCSQDLHD